MIVFGVFFFVFLVLDSWCMCPSRTPPPPTSSSASTDRGHWQKWGCFFTHRSASSTGRHSGKKNASLPYEGFGFYLKNLSDSSYFLHFISSVPPKWSQHILKTWWMISVCLTKCKKDILCSGLIFMPICWPNFKIQLKWFPCLTKSKCTERKAPWPQSTCRQVSSLNVMRCIMSGVLFLLWTIRF